MNLFALIVIGNRKNGLFIFLGMNSTFFLNEIDISPWICEIFITFITVYDDYGRNKKLTIKD